MKKKKIRTMFLTLLGLTSVFLFTNASLNPECAPTILSAQQGSHSTVETLTADFSMYEGSEIFEECFDRESYPFGRPYHCVAYRYKKDARGRMTLLQKDGYNGGIEITEVKPLPGTFANIIPIKGIKEISFAIGPYRNKWEDFDPNVPRTGILRWSNRRDFRNDSSIEFTNSITKTFSSNFPAYFKIETKSGCPGFTIDDLKIVHDDSLGTVNDKVYPAGLNQYRLRSDGARYQTRNIEFNPNHEGRKALTAKVYSQEEKYTSLTHCAAQILGCMNDFKSNNFANYTSLNVNDKKGYVRNDGYVQCFGDAYIKDQRYYEFDVPLAPNQTTRGTGRLVYFSKGVTSTGYAPWKSGDNYYDQPIILFTDDHYMTFCEYLNYCENDVGVFGPRFSTYENCPITGTRWTPATTVLETSKVEGSGTFEEVDKINRGLSIYPNKSLNLVVNQQIQLTSVLNGYDGKVKYRSNNDVVYVDENTGLLTAKKEGSAEVDAYCNVDPPNYGTITSTILMITVEEMKDIEVIGDYTKLYYAGQVFSTENIQVVYHNKKGLNKSIEAWKCSWLNPITRKKEMTVGQTEVLCVYEGLEVTLPGITVLEPTTSPTSLTLNYPSGKIQVGKPLNLAVATSPVADMSDVEWILGFASNPDAAIIQGNVLIPKISGQIISVTAYSRKYNLIGRSFFKIDTYQNYSKVKTQEELIDGEYLIGSGNYVYDPTILTPMNSSHTIIEHDYYLHPVVGSKLLIRKVPDKENHYYIQIAENLLYIDSTLNIDRIVTNATLPVAHHIEIMADTSARIYDYYGGQYIQFDPRSLSFLPDFLDKQNPVCLYRETSSISGTTACEAFIEMYMHMNNYKENLGWCLNSDEHQYYANAKAAFELMRNKERALFATEYKYKDAWARFNAWAKSNNETIHVDDVGNVSFNTLKSNAIATSEDNVLIIALCITLVIGFSFAFVLIKRKKIED